MTWEKSNFYLDIKIFVNVKNNEVVDVKSTLYVNVIVKSIFQQINASFVNRYWLTLTN